MLTSFELCAMPVLTAQHESNCNDTIKGKADCVGAILKAAASQEPGCCALHSYTVTCWGYPGNVMQSALLHASASHEFSMLETCAGGSYSVVNYTSRGSLHKHVHKQCAMYPFSTHMHCCDVLCCSSTDVCGLAVSHVEKEPCKALRHSKALLLA